MVEIRLHPFTKERIIINEKRMLRPTVLNKSDNEDIECPFCSNSTQRHPGLPKNYEAISVINLYSALTENPENVTQDFNPQFQKIEAYGICEVVLYSDNHHWLFHSEPIDEIIKIIQLWKNREYILGSNPKIKYVYIFENHGVGVGVTIHHPHGQIYALPFIPPYIVLQLENSEIYFKENSGCLQCQIIKSELVQKIRILIENETFVAFSPFYSRLLFEIHIYPKRHIQYLSDLNQLEERDLAHILQEVRRKYDLLFDHPANYMMMFFPAPSDETSYYFHHFHIEFVCLDRDNNKLKYRAGIETGLLVWTNDLAPETIVKIMREL